MGFRSRRVLGSIVARGGSKGVPRKNLLELSGIPLVGLAIRQAQQTGAIDFLSVSSDSEEILAVAKEYGADCLVKRPAALASDSAGKIESIRHNVLEAEKVWGQEAQIIVDLDVTAPLRQTEDILGSLALLLDRDVGNVITGTPARRSPYFNLVEVTEGVAKLSKPVTPRPLRRQDVPPCFDMNAAVYVWKRPVLLEDDAVVRLDTALYEMPPERSVDLDCPLDWEWIQFLHRKKQT